MIKAEPTNGWYQCIPCDSNKNVTKYSFGKGTPLYLCLKCRKEMAKLLEED